MTTPPLGSAHWLDVALALGVAFLAIGCGNEAENKIADVAARDPGTTRLSKADQETLDFCYVIVRPEIADRLKLSGVQRVKMALHANHLNGILNYYTPGSDGAAEAQITRAWNDLSTKVPRTLELAARIRTSLDSRQIEAFNQTRKDLDLQPIKPLLGEERYALKYTLSGKESYREITLKNGKTAKVLTLPKSDSAQWPVWLESSEDLKASLRAEESELQRAGVQRAQDFPIDDMTLADRAAVADTLLELAGQEPRPGLIRAEILEAASRFASEPHQAALITLAAGARSRELTAIVASLLRIAPQEALKLTRERAASFPDFSAALKAFERHGRSAGGLLLQLDKELQGQHRSWIQKALAGTGSGIKLAIEKKRPPIKEQPRAATSPPATADSNDWMDSLESDDVFLQATALKSLGSGAPTTGLKPLEPETRKHLAELCAKRLTEPRFASLAKDYGELLLTISGRDSLNIYNRLCESAESPARRYGLAGLMRLSTADAVKTIQAYEQDRMGMHDVTDAAKIVGTEAITSLKSALPKLKKRISQMAVERQLENLGAPSGKPVR